MEGVPRNRLRFTEDGNEFDDLPEDIEIEGTKRYVACRIEWLHFCGARMDTGIGGRLQND